MDSAILYQTDRLRCNVCHSFPLPPVYHCIAGHSLCSNCHDNHPKQCPFNHCKKDMALCKVTTFLLTRMKIICPNDKSHGCSTSLPIEDFNTHVDQCSHSPPLHTYSCPCCGTPCVDTAALFHHFNTHEPTEVAPEQSEILTLTQGSRILLRLGSSRTYFLLRFEGDVVGMQNMWWDQPRYHALRVSYMDNDWEFTGEKSSDTLSATQQYLKLSLSPDSIEVMVAIGFFDAKGAVLDLDDLPHHDEYPDDAPVKDLTCFVCYEIITTPAYHCMAGHTVCQRCKREKARYDKAVGKEGEELLKCASCTLRVMSCDIGSFILDHLEFPCPNRNGGCQHVSLITNFEKHINNCSKTFMCPVCQQGFDDPNHLRIHIDADHRPKIINHMQQNRVMLPRLRSFIRDGSTNDDFLLLFEDNAVCLQHMPWAHPQLYYIEFSDLGCTWSFNGKTVPAQKFPILNKACLKIPSSVLNPKSTLPIPLTLEVRYAEKKIKRRRLG